MSKVVVSGENFKKYLEVISDVNKLLDNIKNDTGGYSTHVHILKHPDFKKLVEYGDKLVSYIFYLILEQGNDWVYMLLLKEITHQSPVTKEHWGSFIHETIDWLTWYSNSDFYKNNDVYHGLVK